ncbi:MAG: penicillin-binding transpeptidase domain-containing protein [Lachnospiraceae bacterium]
MFDTIKEFGKKLIKSRLFVLGVVMTILFMILIQRIFVLQIIKGQTYLDNYTLRIQKERITSGTRGGIYDRNGTILAYNELSYSVTFEDNEVYDTNKQRNKNLNAELNSLIKIIEEKGNAITNTFNIQMQEDLEYHFTVSETSLKRFLADVYGHTKVDDLSYNKKLGYNEGSATPIQVMDYLMGDTKFQIKIKGTDKKDTQEDSFVYDYYTPEEAYKILVLRYAISQNSYQKYILTTIAQDVSEETVAVIKENSQQLPGVDISEDSVRRYADSKYFSHIIGYTGKISQNEYDNLVKKDKAYNLNDVIGKSGIEQVMEQELQGGKGKETFYVDSLGRVLEITDKKDATSGNNIYLSIDGKLQKAVYDMLEQELAGIIYSKIINAKEYDTSSGSASDIKIPIDDVYYSLINNNVININEFTKEDATGTEQEVYRAFLSKQESAIASVKEELNSSAPINYEDLDSEMQIYMSYVATMLMDDGILIRDNIDTDDDTYRAWKTNKISLSEYLKYAISMEDWVDITSFETESKYSDTTEIYNALVNHIETELKVNRGFSKNLYKYMIRQDMISGAQLCSILFEQGVLAENQAEYQSLQNGTLSSYTFLRDKIKNLELTPAQLALDPCTASCVMVDVKTGELLACVTYPGYDTNRLANNVDAAYFAGLQEDLSLPQYNNATQQRIAPGSTFKPITAFAGLTEGVVGVDEPILDEGQFTKIFPSPKCWIYANGGTHGLINISQAIRDSCNYFFYEVGYRLSSVGETYTEDKGIAAIQKYASLFGLDEQTGIEIPENSPQISNEFPITSAIGQGNHAYTTTQMARYLTAVASSGNVYGLTLLDKETASDGTAIQDFSPKLIRTIDEIAPSSWNAVHQGMRMVVENNGNFKDFPENIAVAGKTGTAQQNPTRANHAMFIGYAPYDDPKISITTRIAYGYTSANAAEASSNILKYYFNLAEEETLLNGQAEEIGDSANGFTD